MKICAFKGNSEVSIKVRTFPVNMQTEIKHAADTLHSQCDDSDLIEVHIKKRIHFLCDQLAFCSIERDAGRHYNSEIMQMAVKLMLCS